jgi:hypothetical protein
MIILAIVLFVLLTVVQYILWVWTDSKKIEKENEIESLREGIIHVMKKLKPENNITIHYGNDKQLTFIRGKLQ